MRGTIEGLQYRRLAAALIALMVLSIAASTNTAWAVTTIVQDPNEKWLAFEAEDYHELIDLDGDGVTWTTIDDVDADPNFGASGGKAIQADVGVNFDTNEAEAVYNVKFTRPDFYGLYVRYKNLAISGNNDSFWSSGDPDSIQPDPLRTWFSDSPASIPRTLGSSPDAPPLATAGVPQYFWDRVSIGGIGFFEDPADDSAQVGEVLQFRIGIREQGSIIDRIVFADTSSPGPVDQTGGGHYSPLFQLDALTNSPIETDSVPGDYNGNGVVDAGDYTSWLDNLGAADESIINDNGDGLNGVDAADYGFWKSRFGNTAGAGTGTGSSTIPEPASWLLLLVGSLAFACRRRA